MFLFALPLGATTIPSGTGAYGIKFTTTQMGIYGDYGVQCIAFKFFDADVSLEFFLSGVRVDSTFQLEGSAVTYTTPCDSINVTRVGITAGVYLIGSKDGSKCPELHSSIESDSSLVLADSLQTLTEAMLADLDSLIILGDSLQILNETLVTNGDSLLILQDSLQAIVYFIETDTDSLLILGDSLQILTEANNIKLDSLVLLASEPEPRTISSPVTIVDGLTLVGANHYTSAAAAVNMYGCVGAIVTLEWVGLTDKFKMYHLFSSTASDTSTSTFNSTSHPDSSMYNIISDVNCKYDKATILLSPEGNYFMGYYRGRFLSLAGDGVTTLVVTIERMY
jgi:hypothetical protein